MGSGEAATPAKASKTSSAAQEQPSPPAGYHPEWAAFQAYYPGGTHPPGYFPPSAGPQPHPYMWSAQMMPYVYPPHYGMPPGPHPYGQYGMPVPGSTNDASAAATADTDGKSSDGKEKSPLKRSKGITKATEGAKSGSANGVVSQSGESMSDGSSEGSDEDQNGTEKRNSEQMTEGANAGQQGYSGQGNNAAVAPGGKTPVGTTLNMGMDYWGGQPAANASSGKGKRNAQAMAAGMSGGQLIAPGRDGVPPELWLQDERELKRQRRKQSNRESARRSRLRKQAECEELAQRVDSLTVENMSLRQELEQVIEERNKLMADNAALVEQLQKSGRQNNGADVANNNSNNNSGEEALQQGEEKEDAPAAEMNGRIEGENCETIGKAAVAAAAAAANTNRGEAVAAAG